MGFRRPDDQMVFKKTLSEPETLVKSPLSLLVEKQGLVTVPFWIYWNIT